jgi:hypothetical protein
MKTNPEILIIGTGNSGMMRVFPETTKYLKEHNIQLIEAKTEDTCQKFNELADTGKSIVAALHLTC